MTITGGDGLAVSGQGDKGIMIELTKSQGNSGDDDGEDPGGHGTTVITVARGRLSRGQDRLDRSSIMGTGPLALDDVLAPSFDADEETGPPGYVRMSKSSYLDTIQNVYNDRPSDGRGDLLGSLVIAGEYSYAGATSVAWGVNGGFGASVNPGYFAMRVLRDGNSEPALPGSGGHFPHWDACPLKPDPVNPDGDEVHEDADLVVSAIVSAEINIDLTAPLVAGSNWHDADKVWVRFAFSASMSERSAYQCESGGSGGGSSRELDCNVLGFPRTTSRRTTRSIPFPLATAA